jgi:hypothetical protein
MTNKFFNPAIHGGAKNAEVYRALAQHALAASSRRKFPINAFAEFAD